MAQYSGVSAMSFLPYADDTGTGRCRLPKNQFNNLNITILSILHFEITVPYAMLPFEIACTACPDYKDELSNNLVCIDHTALITRSASKYSLDTRPEIPNHWISCILKV